MKPIKVVVNNHVYCSSSLDYFIELGVINVDTGRGDTVKISSIGIHITKRDRRVKREKRYTWREARYPRYVWQAIADELLKSITEDKWKFYEYDREGIERYEDLRYHDKERFDSFVKYRHNRICQQYELVPLLPSESLE